MSDNDREGGGKREKGGGEEVQRDLCMVIRLLEKTLTDNFLSTSRSPDSTRPLSSLFSLLPTLPIPPPVPPTYPPYPPVNPRSAYFSLFLPLRHRSLIIESLLSRSKAWRRRDRAKEGRHEASAM